MVARPYDTVGSIGEDTEGSTSEDFAGFPVISIPDEHAAKGTMERCA